MSEARLMQGNEACAEGALAAGVRFFGGYPITPSTEIAEVMAKLLPTPSCVAANDISVKRAPKLRPSVRGDFGGYALAA